jgi:hypothetical protein
LEAEETPADLRLLSNFRCSFCLTAALSHWPHRAMSHADIMRCGASPGEIGRAAACPACDDSAIITGATIVIDGGLTI